MSAAVREGYKQTEVGVIPQDWEVLPLGELAITIASGRSASGSAYGDYCVHGSTGVIGYCDEPMYAGDAILIARVGANAGLLNFVSGRYGVTDNTIIVRLKGDHFLPFFWRQLEAKRLNSLVFGSGQPLITGSQLKALALCQPSAIEQRAIATALSDVDALLTKLEQLIAKKRDLKQAAMQQLLTGKTRLPEFSGEWEVKRLGDIGDCLRGVTYSGDEDLFAFDTPRTKRLLRSNNVQDATVVYSDIQFVNADRVASHQILTLNDVLICMANGSKALVGKAGFFQSNEGCVYTFGAFMGCFRTASGLANASFVFYLFQTGKYRNYINNLLAGSSINNLSPGGVESLEFSMPALPEQTAIATVLSDIDADITALESRRDKTRALKQGMMQVLLTGQIRLV